MQVTINNKDYNIPFDTNIISISEYIDYNEMYGLELDKELQEIYKKKYEDTEDQVVDLDNHLDKEAISWFSFWTKLDLFQAKETPDIIPILNEYRNLKSLLIQEDVDLPKIYDWHDSKWQIQDWRINPQSEMNFNEVITSKEITRQVFSLGKGKIFALKYLCCVFFRKTGEIFSDSLVYENGDRMVELTSLPLSYALNVSFFLSLCVSIWSRPSAYSQEEAA